MTRMTRTLAGAAIASAACVSLALSQDTKPSASNAGAQGAAGNAQQELPPGMTPEMMEAWTKAATPGPMHQWLAEDLGTWNCKCTMYMAPGAQPTSSESTMTVRSNCDGRFFTTTAKGDMPEFGPFEGHGTIGYDNATGQFQAFWYDNMGTGMAVGTGTRSEDGKTLTITYTYNCPIAKQPCSFREVMTRNSADSRTYTMYMPDMETGKEYMNMQMELTRAAAPTKERKSRNGG